MTQYAWFTLFVRNTLLEVLREDHVQFARAQGIGEIAVLLRYALPNALIPFVTLIGTHLSELIGGTILVEEIFGWPGLGQLTLQAALGEDIPLLVGITLCGFGARRARQPARRRAVPRHGPARARGGGMSAGGAALRLRCVAGVDRGSREADAALADARCASRPALLR